MLVTKIDYRLCYVNEHFFCILMNKIDFRSSNLSTFSATLSNPRITHCNIFPLSKISCIFPRRFGHRIPAPLPISVWTQTLKPPLVLSQPISHQLHVPSSILTTRINHIIITIMGEEAVRRRSCWTSLSLLARTRSLGWFRQLAIVPIYQILLAP